MSSAFVRSRAASTIATCLLGVSAMGGVVMAAAPAVAASSPAPSSFTTTERAVSAYGWSRPVELTVDRTTLTEEGQTVRYRLRIVNHEIHNVDSNAFYPLRDWSVNVDLSKIADDVADIDDVFDGLFDEISSSPVAGVTANRSGNVLQVSSSEFPGSTDFELTFSVTYAGTGDGDLSLTTTSASAGYWAIMADSVRWDYGTQEVLTVPVNAAQPVPLVAKNVDRTQVTAVDSSVEYTVTVTRPASDRSNAFSLTDDLSDVIAEAGGVTPSDFTAVRGTLSSQSVVNGVLQVEGAYDANGKFVLTYTADHLAQGDGIMTNVVCAKAPDVDGVEAVDPTAPVSSSWSWNSPQVRQVAITAGNACASAADVTKATVAPPSTPPVKPTTPAAPEPPQTETETAPPTDDVKPETHPSTAPEEPTQAPAAPSADAPNSQTPGAVLAATGSDATAATGMAAFAAALISVGAMLFARVRSRRRA